MTKTKPLRAQLSREILVPSYETNYAKAARRHWSAAEALPDTCRSVAGYLYGVAAECAVKAVMRGVAKLQELPEDRRADPYYAHYPHLAPLLRERISGRIAAAELAAFARDSFLQGWDTDMRYSDGSAVTESRVSSWREDAERAVSNV